MLSGVVGRFPLFAVDAVGNGRNQPDFVAQSAEHLVKQSCSCCFTICAGDADQSELSARITVECGGDVSHGGGGVGYPDVAHLLVEGLGPCFADDGRSTLSDSIVDKAMSVGLCSPYGEEDALRIRLTRIECKAGDRTVQIALGLDHVRICQKFFQNHRYKYIRCYKNTLL